MSIWWSLSHFNPQCVSVCILWSMNILGYILEFGLAQKCRFSVILGNILKSSHMMKIRCSLISHQKSLRKVILWRPTYYYFKYNAVFLLRTEKIACFWLSTGEILVCSLGIMSKTVHPQILGSCLAWWSRPTVGERLSIY